MQGIWAWWREGGTMDGGVKIVHASEKLPLQSSSNDEAPWNISVIWVTLVVSHPERSWWNDVAEWNMAFINTTLEVSHSEMSWLKAEAPTNILDMSVTLEVSHPEISWLKVEAPKNILDVKRWVHKKDIILQIVSFWRGCIFILRVRKKGIYDSFLNRIFPVRRLICARLLAFARTRIRTVLIWCQFRGHLQSICSPQKLHAASALRFRTPLNWSTFSIFDQQRQKFNIGEASISKSSE